MEALRKSLTDPTLYPSANIDLARLVEEWNALVRSELKGWFLLQLMAALNRNIIDVDVFFSLTLAHVRGWDQFPLVGLALRCGANPNVYFRVPGLGAAHALIYAMHEAKRNNLAAEATSALCLMLLAMGSRLDSPAFSEYGNVRSSGENNENLGAYNQSLLLQVSMPRDQPDSNKIKLRSVAQELAVRGIAVTGDYLAQLKAMAGYVPAIVGTSLAKAELAFLIADHIPEFEYLLACQANELFESYPRVEPAKHTQIVAGEVVGMRQAIEGGCYKAFMLFLKSGVVPSYFLLTRLCYYLSEAYLIRDSVYFSVLINMLNICLGTGSVLDLEQYKMLQVASAKAGKNSLGDITVFLEEVYRVPRWRRACKAPTTAEVPLHLRQLAFNLGIDPNQDRDGLCGDLERLDLVDATKIREAALARQKHRISDTVATVSDFVGMSKPSTSCANSSGAGIIPEEYNDVLMSFYKDGDKVYCFTSASYEDIIQTQQEPISGKPLTPEYVAQLRARLEIIRQLGLDPRRPTPVFEAAAKLREKEALPPVRDEFASNTIIKILAAERLAPLAVTSSAEELNTILRPLAMQQDLLAKLQPNHQITTFYEAVYYRLRSNPSEASIFIDSYRNKGQIPLRPTPVASLALPGPPPRTFVTYPASFSDPDSSPKQIDAALLDSFVAPVSSSQATDPRFLALEEEYRARRAELEQSISAKAPARGSASKAGSSPC